MRRSKLIRSVLCALILLLLPAPSSNAASLDTGDAIVPEQMTLAFEDEFDKLDISAWGPGTRWISHTPWSGDFGGARFGNPGEDSPFTIDSGSLRIEATRDEAGNWRSGLLASMDPKGNGFAQQYGYFEIRAKLPDGPGVWPAFWLIGKDRSKATAEIDVLEFYGDKPGGYSTVVHVWRKGGEHYSKGKRIEVFADKKPTEFHTYGVKIDETFIRIYCDREMVWKTPTQAEHRQPLYMLLNLALVDGPSNFLTPDPSHMYVDYVRAYKLD